ncbi:MAG: hypothetical protein V1904_03920 [Bacteroidota bacterium]
MIKKSLIIFIILFVSYNLIISLLKPKTIGQDQWQLNRIQAQEYLYEDNKQSEIVIAGTSLSAGLFENLLPENTYNLAMRGQSTIDGLEIVKKKQQKPDILLIEINNIYTERTVQFLDNLFLPIFYTAKKIFPALRDKYRASSIAEMALYSIKQHLYENLKKYFLNSEATSSDKLESNKKNEKKLDGIQMKKENDINVKPALFEMMLSKMVYQFQEMPGEKITAHMKKILTDYKNYFERSGVQIILFEMPVHEKLVHSKKATHIRKMMYEIFPPDRFRYVLPDNKVQYNTSDGIHLTPHSMMNYTVFLTNNLNKIRLSQNVNK